MDSRKRRWTFFISGTFLVLSLATGTWYSLISLRTKDRQDRLTYYHQAQSRGDVVLAQMVLTDLVKDFPQDPEVRAQFGAQIESDLDQKKAETLAAAQEQNRQLRLIAGLTNLRKGLSESDQKRSTFEVAMGGFDSSTRDRWAKEDDANRVVKAQAQTRQGQDFLFRIFGEKPSVNPITAAEIDQGFAEATRALQDGEWGKATTLTQKLLRNDPSNPRAAALWLYATVNAFPNLKDAARLLPVSETLLQVLPGNGYALFGAAKVSEALGQDQRAEDRLQQCIGLDPRPPLVKVTLIALWERMKKWDQAEGLAAALWDEGPKSETLGLIVWASLAKTSPERQGKFLDDWGQAVPASALPNQYSGDLKSAAGDPSGAAAAYQTALSKRPSKALLVKLADSWVSAGQPQKATSLYRQAMKQVNTRLPQGLDEYQTLATRLIDADVTAQAWEDVLTDGVDVIRDFPQDRHAKLWVATAYLTKKAYAQARDVVEADALATTGLDLLPSLFEAYWGLGRSDKIRDRIDAVLRGNLTEAQRQVFQDWKQRVTPGAHP